MALIPDDIVDSVREAVDLADLIGRYVPLKKAGSRSFKACCPFHQEKTPSFHIWTETRTWHCFGCGKGGSAFHFLMEREGLTFPQAVRQLGKDAGIRIDEDDDPAAAEQASRLARLREVMERACRFYEKALRSAEGEVAKAYLRRRGIEEATIVRFRLGYAPPGWQNLLEAAHRSGIAEQDLVDLGLARRKDAEEARPARLFDMFRDRVMFPICDTQGRVIAFGARTLGDDEPKYLNSPETPLFVKGRNVYALHLAKQEMLRSGDGAVMEGYTDVILAHQCGWPVAVAGLGTALTREQASLVARYVKRLWLVYDGDAAGLKAAEKNAPSFLPEEIETRVAVLPAGEDPCDLLLRAGLPALRACLDAGLEAFDHLLASKAAAHDMTSVPGKAQALDEALNVLVPVTSEVRRALYLKRVAEAYLIHEDVVMNRFRDLRAKGAWSERRAPAPLPTAVSEAPPRGAPAAPAPQPRREGPPPAVEDLLLEAMLGRPALWAEVAERLPRSAVGHPLTRALLDALLARADSGDPSPDPDAVLGALQDREVAAYAAGLRARGLDKDLERQGRDCIGLLAAHYDMQRLREGQGWLSDPTEARRAFDAGENERLRQELEFHRRRATRGT